MNQLSAIQTSCFEKMNQYSEGGYLKYFGHGLRFTIHIKNFDIVSEILGPACADQMLTSVCSSLQELEARQINKLEVRPTVDGSIDVFIDAGRSECRLLVQGHCAVIAATPINLAGRLMLPVLSLDFDRGEGGVDDCDARLPRVEQDGAQGGVQMLAKPQLAPSLYEADMAAATSLLKAIRYPARLAWQPVRHADDPLRVLYRKGAMHLLDHHGVVTCFDDHVLSSERIGASPAIDCCLVSRVLDELEASPAACLGVAISASSAIADFWWEEIFARLERNRLLGPRLFLELRGTAPFHPIGKVTVFVDGLRRLGCKIAIGDFGVGFGSIRSLLALRADVIKIDAFFLHRASRSDGDRQAFLHLAGLAMSLAPDVVAEGVDTTEQAALAREAGVFWQEGRHHGLQSICRPWPTNGHEQGRHSLPKGRIP
jgi:EAL domain-containing protein (putative c-di-GMP-specific phosphodiesterase class I)